MRITPKALPYRARRPASGEESDRQSARQSEGGVRNLEAVLEPLEHGIFILRGGKE